MSRTDVLADQRHDMVARQIAARGVADDRVIQAMKQVPREAFVPRDMKGFAYEDSPLPIGEEQTISQPYIVAEMLALAGIEPGDTVLEVGAGSGYAAAVMSKIADKVFAVERHGVLAERARETLKRLGYANVEIRHGDGAAGLPDAAPFNAIIVSAGGALPDPLVDQLAVGGRIVIPLEVDDEQVLTVIKRTETGELDVTDHGLVRFVPLVSEAPQARGGGADAPGRRPEAVISARERETGLSAVFASRGEAFEDEDALAALVERFADRKVVCLGESTHGTSEFYTARAAITERLVRDHGFNIVAVEADWPDAAFYDRVIRTGAEGKASREPFTRFPRWMWRNEETWDLLKRLRDINAGREPQAQAGFHGLDVYSLCASIEAVLGFLKDTDPDAAEAAAERYACLAPYCTDPAAYGRMALSRGYEACEDDVAKVLTDTLKTALDGEALFDAEQNARIVREAERYYRVMYYGGAESWNLRDSHMADTLDALLEQRGPGAKAVVWAHNSHIGNAAATEMGWARGEHNLGQLVRERYGEEAALIGFSTARGEVAAADDWDGPMQVKAINAPLGDSVEDHAVRSGAERFMLDITRLDDQDKAVLREPRRERAIGVIYRPGSELQSHYFHADLSEQFDAFVWFETTRAVAAKPSKPDPGEDLTFPFGP